MKTLIKNFFGALRRFKMATLLNVLGLSVAFAAFIVIIMQVSYDLRFDSSIPDVDNVYRINLVHDGERIAATPRPIGEGFAIYSPHVKAVAINNAMFAMVFDRYFSISAENTDSQQQIYAEKMMETTAGYLDIFRPEIVEGRAESFLEPDNVLIPQSMAQRLFKNEPAVGKRFIGEGFSWIVGGVYKDFPKNSSVHNFILLQMPKHDHWALNYETYISIDPSQDADALLAEYIATIDQMIKNNGFDNAEFFLTPVKTLHFDTTIGFDTVEKTSASLLWVLVGVAVIILLIAAINFTNYSIALAPLRIKSINTQKVLGATQAGLRVSLTMEAVLVCFASFGVSLFLVHLISLSPISGLLSCELVFKDNILSILIVGVIAMLTGLFAGIYPAFYATSIAPAVALKGNFGLSLRGRRLRSALVGVQYVASFFLIVAALFMHVQTRYMQHLSPGYDRSKIIVITTNKQFSQQHELFARELSSLPVVEAVGYSEALLASRDHYDVFQGENKEAEIIINAIRADVDFLQTMDVPLLDGRYFTKSDLLVEEEGFIVLNERAKKAYNLQVGDKIDGVINVVGFIPDINYTSLRKEIEPMGFFLDPTRRFAYVRVKEGADRYSAMQEIDKVLQRLSPGFPFDIRPLDNVSNDSYTFENNIMLLITLFSVLAILLSMVGVFGMVIFESEYKRKEIGIRKVFGSTTKEILEMLNKRYIYLLVICFIIAAPVAWYAINLWLQSFAYKIPMYWWVFATTFLLVTTLTSATVTFQSWRVANANPVDSIKTE